MLLQVAKGERTEDNIPGSSSGSVMRTSTFSSARAALMKMRWRLVRALFVVGATKEIERAYTRRTVHRSTRPASRYRDTQSYPTWRLTPNSRHNAEKFNRPSPSFHRLSHSSKSLTRSFTEFVSFQGMFATVRDVSGLVDPSVSHVLGPTCQGCPRIVPTVRRGDTVDISRDLQ
jgi:hypothetical protein